LDSSIKLVECNSCADARTSLHHCSPDLVVIDQQLGDGLGTDLACEIAGWANLRNSALMILSGGDCVALADFAADSPCQLLVSKDELSDQILFDLIADAIDLQKFRDIPTAPPCGPRFPPNLH
jgi:hypothetical protein